MKEVIKNIWSENPEKFNSVEHTSQKNVLHPLLADLINDEKPKLMLDFGCGDGRILKMINKGTSIDVYDKNAEMLEIAKYNVGDRINQYYNDITLIPNNHYDIVLLTMVLICIDNPTEFRKVLLNINRVKKISGLVIIAEPHPCFRDRLFSNVSTSYFNNQPFKYLNDCEPFDITIEDPETIEDQMPPSVTFTDFHKSLSFTLNKIIEAGMQIISLTETTDDLKHSEANKFQSPFLIIQSQ